MGHSAFHITHRPDTERYGRCVGVPHVFADVALLDTDTGEEVPVGQVGHFGLKSPTLAPGYWNDHVNTYRNRLNGYYLTGDLMFRDEEGYYYHVDRAVDSVAPRRRQLALHRHVGGEDPAGRARRARLHRGVLHHRRRGRVRRAAVAARERRPVGRSHRRGPRRATPAAAATLRKVVVFPDENMVTGPTGKVRKFLMRQRHLAEMANA